MYTRPKVEKAQLVNYDAGKGPAGGIKKHEFQFNPKEISISRGVTFKGIGGEGGKPHSDWSGLKWSGAEMDKITLSFILDESEPEPDLINPLKALHNMSPIMPAVATLMPAKMSMVPGTNRSSVKNTIDILYSFTLLVDPKDDTAVNRRPYLLKFVWGDIIFAGGISSFEFKFLLFDSDGSPKRAEVNMEMEGRYCRDPSEASDKADLLAPDKVTKKVKASF